MPPPYFSEVDYFGPATQDFIEIAVDAGTDVSNFTVTVYKSNGDIKSTHSLGTLVATEFGKDIYVIYTAVNKKDGLALDDNGTVHQFISFDPGSLITPTTGAAAGLTSVQIGHSTNTSSLETTDGGATYQNQEDENPGTIPCLTRGTQVATPDGAKEVEALRPGQSVLNVDGNPIKLRLILSRVVGAAELAANPKLCPVRITAGALGGGLPERDLLVSRQHRMLITSPIAQRMFGQADILVAAIRLAALPGIFVDPAAVGVEYFHLLFDRHEVVYAEGAPTESLFLGAETLGSVSPEVMEEIVTLFPEVTRFGYTPSAVRLIPSNKLQRQLVRRHASNKKALLPAS